ncbi:MAG: YjbH domain-containing protein [Rhodospirillales bacterium]|nr:YjbH domain-containing protein [Rhodospirillales bacterium]
MAQAAEPRTFYGVRGLNTVPDARADETGRVHLTLSRMGRYTHGILGAQMSDHVYVAVRQSAEADHLFEEPERLYPGLDTKLQLWDETAFRPAAALGLQSAFGHKRMAGEYLALSKRWNEFDATLGMGWGRFGQAGHFKNPFGLISHFDKNRPMEDETANDPSDWFTGERVGVFAGLSYELPVKGLVLTADWNADRYQAERAATGNFQAPAPWSLGVQYQPSDSFSAGIGVMGGDQVMGRMTLSPNVADWPWRAAKKRALPPVTTERPAVGKIEDISVEARDDGQILEIVAADGAVLDTVLSVEDSVSAPAQYGRAVRHMMRQAPPEVTTFRISPHFAGLQGARLSLIRRDLEQALGAHAGSADEIWQSAEFDRHLVRLPYKGINAHNLWPDHIILQQQVSLSEEDQGVLSRTGLIIEEQRAASGPWAVGGALRLNLGDNLQNLNAARGRPFLPVRSDIDLFARQTVSLDRMYLSYLKTLWPDVHVGATVGYLEEQYAGAGGELLYRPFGRNWAIGAEAWGVFKRNPLTAFNQGIGVDHLLSGHVQGWYRLPQHPETTVHVRLGRYLAEDLGGTLGLVHRFKNGAKLEGFVTMTDQSDTDVFGGTTHLQHGVKLSLPLGSLDYIPDKSRMDLVVAPFGRDSGQHLDKPVSLYDLTEAFSLQHVATHWGDLVGAEN